MAVYIAAENLKRGDAIEGRYVFGGIVYLYLAKSGASIFAIALKDMKARKAVFADNDFQIKQGE